METERARNYYSEYYLRNKDKILERTRKYYWDNRENSLETKKKYYLRNRDEILSKSKQKETCECGCSITKKYINKHRQSERHINAMKVKRHAEAMKEKMLW